MHGSQTLPGTRPALGAVPKARPMSSNYGRSGPDRYACVLHSPPPPSPPRKSRLERRFAHARAFAPQLLAAASLTRPRRIDEESEAQQKGELEALDAFVAGSVTGENAL